MIVGINARILATDKIRGWSRYTYNLIHGLNKNNIKVVLFSDKYIDKKWLPENLHTSVFVQTGLNYIHWEQFVLPELCLQHKVDILHCPINYGLPIKGNFKKILTLHDAIEKSYYDQFKSIAEKVTFTHLKMRSLHYLSQRAASKIITVSEFAKNDIVFNYGVDAEKISVIYEAAENHFNAQNIVSSSILEKKWSLQPGYYFYVGGLEKRKNISFLIDLFSRLESKRMRLVIAGDLKENTFKNHSKNIQFIGYVEDDFLPSLYAHSKALVYPSFHEGFGLQLVESMSMDRPCIYASTSSLPEIYGTNEYGFDPRSIDDAVKKIIALENHYEDAIDYVVKRKLFFSWTKTIAKTIELYQSVL